MKFPPPNSRARTILGSLLAAPATVYQGIERHTLLGISEGRIINIYQQLEVDGWLIKTGMVYSASLKTRLHLAPPEKCEEELATTAPAYRGNWAGSTLNVTSARRSGAAFGLNFRQ